MELQTSDILKTLKETAEILHWDGEIIEILLIGGAAGMLSGQLSAHRVTQDCDVVNFRPEESQKAVLDAALQIAHKKPRDH